MRQSHEQQSGGAAGHYADARRPLYEEVTDTIVRELENGCVPWIKPWSAKSAPLGMPRINILILWDAVLKRGFASQEWLTFRQALSLGGHVRKGERGTSICYADRFIPKSERERAKGEAEKEPPNRNGSRPNGDDPLSVPFLKRFTVFNIEQCDGLPAHIVPPPAPQLDADKIPAAEALIAATGADIREGGGEAFYHRGEDFIRLPQHASFFSAADRFCTASHELGHWTAHPSRLNRDLQHRFGSSAYAREELIAELCSAFLCAHLNIVPQIRHADYLGHWLAILKDDNRAIFHAASQASKATDFILAFGQNDVVSEAAQ
jgi:antirestriction protein ArdC